MRQGVVFGLAEALLAFTVHHLHQCLLVDVAQLVFGEDEVVACIDVTVEFHYAGMATCPCHGAYAGLFAYPIGQCGVEDLDVVRAHIFFDPQIEQAAEEVTPLFGADREVGQWRVIAIGQRSQVASVTVGQDTFYNGSELDVMASQILEEAVKLLGIVGVVVVHHCHAVPFHAVLLQQIDALHHFVE